MSPTLLEVLRAQIQGAQFIKIFRPQTRESVQQSRQRSIFTLPLLSPAVEGFKRLSLAKLQDHLSSRHPIGALAVNEMANDIERAPSLVAFIAERPSFRQIAQQHIESRRSASQKRYGVLQVMWHHSPSSRALT